MKKLFTTLSLITVLSVLSCKNEDEKSETEEYFPALSFLKSQVTQVDSSLFQIIKIVKTDSTADTTYLKREEFKENATAFTTIPDISSEKLKENYTETRLFDEALERVLLSYTPKNKDQEILRQDITILPSEAGDQVKTIFIDQFINKGDSMIQKKMLWQTNKRFQIVTSISKPGQPETVTTEEVIWNDFPASD